MPSFEKTIDDNPWNESFRDESIAVAIRERLEKSRKIPEVIYLKDPEAVAPVEELLTELYGVRGIRTPVLHSPDEREAFTIRWS